MNVQGVGAPGMLSLRARQIIEARICRKPRIVVGATAIRGFLQIRASAGEAAVGAQFTAAAVACIGIIPVVIDCVAAAVGGGHRAAQAVGVQVVQPRFIMPVQAAGACGLAG